MEEVLRRMVVLGTGAILGGQQIEHERIEELRTPRPTRDDEARIKKAEEKRERRRQKRLGIH